jgi:N-carbamoyl-L-amino-acid hydrolase
MGAARPAAFDLVALASRLFGEIATRTADIEGVCRPAYSKAETETLEYLLDFARSEGLAARWDAGRNVVFSLPEHEQVRRYMLIGSHVDSVPHGGNFDGLAGVLAGLLCLVRARREGTSFAQPVKVIAMRGEESAWFGPCYTGSKALLGALLPKELAATHKADGRTLDAHMEAVGVNMADVRAGRPLLDRDAVTAYLEVHIEQGPVLIERTLPVAVVSGIRGNFRYKKITGLGEAGHSGAVPLAYRHDPVLAMAELLNVLEVAWRGFVAQGRDLVVTSGMVSTDHETHALSRIADSVEFSLDIRSQDSEMLHMMHALVGHHVGRIQRERNMRFDLGDVLWTPPALCNDQLVAGLARSMETLGLEPAVIPSGGGHDAAVFSAAGIPSGMIFIRNRNGSHNPHEAMEIGDFEVAASVLYAFLDTPRKARTQQAKETRSMFATIIDIIRDKGNAARAYREAAKIAQERAGKDPERAVGYFLLGKAAQEFAEAYYDEPLHADLAERQLAKLENHASLLDEAFEARDLQRRLDALSHVARSMAGSAFPSGRG